MPLSDSDNVSQEARIKIEEDGSLILPTAFLAALGIKGGDEIVLRKENHELYIRKALRAKPGARRSRWETS